jgi:putative transposase
MARKLRIQFEGACYHIINRGNYRADVFANEGSGKAFETCLWEACEKTGWRLHAYVIMRNHFHLAVETPQPNLVEGMHWLQSTFATRFNRFRSENGHVFQGRYKAILVEPGPTLAYVVNYIHLNPQRAGLLPVDPLPEYRLSSYWHFRKKKKARPASLTCDDWLWDLGGLTDTAAGWKSYQDYLRWLATDETAQKQQAFDKMTNGWALGSATFHKDLLKEHAAQIAQENCGGHEWLEIKEHQWSLRLNELLKAAGKSVANARSDKKSALWKATIAFDLRRSTTASNDWITRNLHMGTPSSVSRWVSAYRKQLKK